MIETLKYKLHMITRKQKLNSIHYSAIVLIIAALISSGIFLLIFRASNSPMLAFIGAQLLLLAGVMIFKLYYFRSRVNRPEEKTTENRESETAEKTAIDYKNIDWPFDVCGPDMADTLNSIVRNSHRLFAVEKQLSDRFRPRGIGDDYTRKLVYQLKICASRLRHDISGISEDSRQVAVSNESNEDLSRV